METISGGHGQGNSSTFFKQSSTCRMTVDFVEALPKVVKDPMSRAAAEKLKAQLEAAGATVTVQAAT
jgi:hypothetical protein